MNLTSTYINELISCYFSPENNGSYYQELLSIKLLAKIFNKYIDYAQESKNFKDLTNVKTDPDFTLALAENLLFILHLMKTNDISYKDMFDSYIKYEKRMPYNCAHPQWPMLPPQLNEENLN